MALIEMDEPAEQKLLASLLGVSQPTVSDLVRRGVLRPGDTLREQLQATYAHLRAAAAFRQDDERIVEQRLRLTRERADGVELENRCRRGELVERALVESAMASKLTGARDKFLTLPDRLAPQLVAESDAAKIAQLLTSEIRDAMLAIVAESTSPTKAEAA